MRMKPTFTLIRFSILTLILAMVMPAKAADPYPVYLTEGGSVTLALATSLKTGEKAVWTENGVPLTSAADGSYTVPAGQSVGIHTYKVHVVSASPALCDGEVLDYEIYVLPKTTVTLNEASVKLYCENAVNPESVFEATAIPADVLPPGVTYSYTWEGTNGGSTLDPNTAWGSSVVSADSQKSTFTFTNKVVGTYALKVKVEYVVPGTSKLKTEADILTKMTSAAQSVEVSPMPSKPAIIVM